MGARSDHWIDRIAVSLTRRQVVRGGLAAAGAAAALPLLRVAPPARAALAEPCYSPCRFQGISEHASDVGQCLGKHPSAKLAEFKGLKQASYGPGLLGVASPLLEQFLAAQECRDQADMNGKVYAWNCTQPNCGGWDPKAPGGPCERCTQYCCPCAAVGPTIGYVCCAQPCADPSQGCCPAS